MNYLNQLSKTLDENYEKLPRLPKGVNDFIVTVAPWLSIIGGLFLILGAINLFRFAMSPLAGVVGGFSFAWIISAVILLISGVLELLAFSPLRVRKIMGWNLIFYVVLLSVLNAVFTISVFSILSAIVFALIGYYFLFNVKSYYK